MKYKNKMKETERRNDKTGRRGIVYPIQPILLSFFFCLRGGVTGRPMFMPPYGYFGFFSAGFRICMAKNISYSTV
jgi:hypothetical protein